MAGLSPLAHLDFDHLHLRECSLLRELFGIECAAFRAATKITAAQFPNEITLMFKMIRADASFARIVIEAAHRSALIERADGVCGKRTKAHGRNVEHAREIGLLALIIANRDPEAFRIDMLCRARRVLDIFIIIRVHVHQRPERVIG